MVDTVQDLIQETFLDLGVLAEGEAPSSFMANGALSKLNSMLEQWSLEKLTVYGSTPLVFPLVAGQSSYTIGPSGNFNTARPIQIQSASLRNTNLPAESRMDIPLAIWTDEQYQSYPAKSQTSNIPFAIWVNYGSPQATITLIPAPNDTSYSLVLWQEGAFANLALTTQFLLPPGFREAIVANLAIRLAPTYGAELNPITAQLASSAKANIQARNLQLTPLMLDPRLTRRWFNPRFGWWM